MENKERIVVMIPAELKNSLLKTAHHRGHTIAFVLRHLISNWVGENKKGPGRKPKKVEGF